MLPIALALLPVSAFLLILVLLDSFKLVATGTLARALLAGAATALVAGFIHAHLLETLDVQMLTRYVAPVTEEALKAIAFFVVVRRRPVGFLVDAGILGFAVGTGFAVVENIEYLRALGSQSLWLWSTRGFGTAMLHGTTTAIVAVLAKSRFDRGMGGVARAVAPGLAIAIGLHGAFNQALVSPLLAAATLMTLLPLAAFVVFDRSERATREWFGRGMDRDVELLNALLSSNFGQTPRGRYLRELTSRFPGPVVADMFCLLRLQSELAIRAKGLVMAREAGFTLPLTDLAPRLEEVRYLQRSIGATGRLALRPLQHDGRDQWHRTLLEAAGTRSRRSS
ncbi:MAG: PrsW family glutamic-type intramembrane protease [Vicinamibacterales bacterium]